MFGTRPPIRATFQPDDIRHTKRTKATGVRRQEALAACRANETGQSRSAAIQRDSARHEARGANPAARQQAYRHFRARDRHTARKRRDGRERVRCRRPYPAPRLRNTRRARHRRQWPVEPPWLRTWLPEQAASPDNKRQSQTAAVARPTRCYGAENPFRISTPLLAPTGYKRNAPSTAGCGRPPLWNMCWKTRRRAVPQARRLRKNHAAMGIVTAAMTTRANISGRS